MWFNLVNSISGEIKRRASDKEIAEVNLAPDNLIEIAGEIYTLAHEPVCVVGDCRHELASWPTNLFHSCITDPPYEIKIMGCQWDDTGVSFDKKSWAAISRVLRPGGYLLAFTSPRTYHRIACAVEDAGFEIVDQIQWIYGCGMPAGGRMGPKIDKSLGCPRPVVGSRMLYGTAALSTAQRGGTHSSGVPSHGAKKSVDITAPGSPEATRWEGWGARMKPGHEPILVARKRFSGSLTGNVLAHGTGAINVTECLHEGRWPPNVLSDAPIEGVQKFFPSFQYEKKPGTAEKTANGSIISEKTVKPLALMRHLVKLVTPPGGLVLDPFCGSGSTLIAAEQCGRSSIGIEIREDAVIKTRTRLKLTREDPG